MKKHFDITIFGLVQGISFRDEAKELANKLGVFGFIRNKNDGSVYAEVEGDDMDVREFIKWCHTGPRIAKVERVVVVEKESISDWKTFEIKS